MKNEVSVLELKHLVVELQSVVGSRIERIYQPEPRTFVLVIRRSGEEKRLLRIDLPKYLYLTSLKEEMPAKLSGFCGYMRKYLEGTSITAIEQAGAERVVKFSLASKESAFLIYLELFGKGNLLVCEPDGTILSCLEQMVFKDRVVKPGASYQVPERAQASTIDEFRAKLESGTRENVSTTLAVDLSLGGLFANELCLLAGVEPRAKDVTPDQAEKLFVAWQNLAKRKSQPLLVVQNDQPVEVIAFPMRLYEKATLLPLKTLSEGLDRLFLAQVQQMPKPSKDKRAEKVRVVISMQEQNAAKLEANADEAQKKGEFMYENYQQIKAILDELQVQMKHHSLQEMQERLKGHRLVREIDPKEGKVVLEFSTMSK
ncbi:NFACT family protein [Candidatus Woesearchaeota archaeon]|nr:NFACT family protein [Candidatus Woesearchaeota archaeon]